MSIIEREDLISQDLVKHWNGLKKRPTVIALDLDYTLWPYFVDCHVDPPIFRRRLSKKLEIVVDSNGFDLSGYNDVTSILHTLKHKCGFDGTSQHLAVASRSTTEDLARRVIDEHGWTEYFSSFQIYPRSKVNHMKKIQDELKFDRFDQVLFFDDDRSNIIATSRIGVVAIEVDQETGFSLDALKKGLTYFDNKDKLNK